jgi:hypothetical protein
MPWVASSELASSVIDLEVSGSSRRAPGFALICGAPGLHDSMFA